MYQIRGTSFGLSNYVCVFSNYESGVTDAQHTAPGLLECPIPPAPTNTDGVPVTGPISLHIVSDVGFSSNRLRFTFFTPPALLGAFPKFGCTDGGTRIVVTGLGFEDYGGVACSFGGVEGPGEVVSATEVACTSPAATVSGWEAGDSRVVPLLVTVNGLHYGADAGGQSEDIIFEYADVPVVSFISPNTGTPSVSSAGGSLVMQDQTARYIRVHGAHFRDGNDLACRFGALLTVAVFVSPSEVDCLIPPLSSATGDAPNVAVTVNGVDFSRGGPSSATFTYLASPELLGLTPALGPVAGGTDVTVIGNGFARGAESVRQVSLVCRFELEDAARLSDSGIDRDSFFIWDVNANVESDSAATCVSPAVSSALSSGTGYASVRVSADGGWSFSRSAPRYLFYQETAVTSVSPATIPASGGGEILVSGEGFLQGEGQLLCLFAGTTVVHSDYAQLQEENRTAFAAVAVWLSPQLLQCELPPLEVKASTSLALEVRVTNNGVDESSSAGQIFVYALPELLSVSPAIGPRTGGTVIKLGVDGWGLPLVGNVSFAASCRWGASLLTPGELSVGSKPGRVSVACTSPSTATLSGSQQSNASDNIVTVALQIDGRNATAGAPLPFTYYDLPVVFNASPSAGGELGGTDVVFTGSGFAFGVPGAAGSGKTVCMFGETTVFAAVVSDSELRCRTPPFGGENVSPTGASVDVKISLNGGVDFGPSSAPFHYVPIARVTGEQGGRTC